MNIQPLSAPPTRIAANGVKFWQAGSLPESPKTDVYELPSGTDSVPQRLNVQHRPWWQGGDCPTATTADGHAMNVKKDGGAVTATDPKTGVTTRLDTNSLDLEVSAPKVSVNWSRNTLRHTEVHCPLQERLSASDGVTTVVSNYDFLDEHVMMINPKDMGSSVYYPVAYHQDYDRTTAVPAMPTKTWHVRQDKENGPLESTPLDSKLEGSTLTLTRPDGKQEQYQLFVAPPQA